jgi:hypothetical protein
MFRWLKERDLGAYLVVRKVLRRTRDPRTGLNTPEGRKAARKAVGKMGYTRRGKANPS